jgi:hypothetical protein
MGTDTQPSPVAAPAPPAAHSDDAATGRESAWKARGPALALVALVVVAAGVYAGFAQLVEAPRVHPDEHLYAGAGASLAEDGELAVRGEEWELGPVYPVVLASVLTVAGDRETAYALYRIANALLFALAAIPIFLLARRLLRPWWSVGVAALALAIPSSMYVSLVMTESVSYLVYSLAALAIALALESPSTPRQLAAIAAVGLAYATRAQFAVLFGALLVGLVAVWALDRERGSARAAIRQAWPSLAVAALGVAVFVVRPLATGASPLDSVGAYEVLFRGYDPLDIVKWGAYHLADLDFYLAFIPVAVAPIVLWLLWGRARDGSRPAAAFVALFLTVNAGMLFVTAAFSSTEFGFDRLHDRNVFYLAPLWLIALVVWLAEGLPRPRVALGIGIALAVALPLILPFRYIASDVGVDVVPSALWARLNDELAGELLTARKLLVLALLVLAVAIAFLPRRYGWVFVGVVVASFATTSVLAWERIVDAPEDSVFAGGLSRTWVDDALPDGAEVTKLYLVSTRCPASALTWHGLYLTEFFNRSVARAAYIGDSIPDGLPIERVEVARDGRLLSAAGRPLVADYVYTQPGIDLEGRRLASGTAANLVLWDVSGRPVRIVGASSDEDVTTVDCT